jgi:hypothetical protein
VLFSRIHWNRPRENGACKCKLRAEKKELRQEEYISSPIRICLIDFFNRYEEDALNELKQAHA